MHYEILVRCPNCGNLAKRLISDRLPDGESCPDKQLVQTECAVCDYFMAMCRVNGHVPLPLSSVLSIPSSNVCTISRGTHVLSA